ncbi:serine hydrolase domain-containing protein [Spirochaeta isovalerica]|uniref:CubicO group peptidase (Beta-lactamase class C family) n=1 Tax=Spirochaeta isovalerica TaxID=150 RepID=A0A841RGE0_9SPIO|nr:serine hydrolase domain-containing protein [Spirochaeta isovalerica]MBB6482287.1 CubicO group peptidase (beta-lactamase class C family) [Spirochaeta isovalerica]
MKKYLLLFILLFLSLLLFTSCSLIKEGKIASKIEAFENGLRHATKYYTIYERMDAYNVPGVSIAFVYNGEIEWVKAYGIANTNNEKKVNTETLFQAASISKPITALAALKMVEEGYLALDEDIEAYLKTWKIPENDFNKDEKVTLRRLLTHTSGFNVHGFPGYKVNEVLPGINSVLNGLGNTSPIVLTDTPGKKWAYSGGGYTVIQKVIEDVTNKSFEVYMEDSILKPIGMSNSTFEQPLPPDLQFNASAAYDQRGNIIDGLWHNYPEKAAAGLWTTPTDLAKYCIEIYRIISDKPNGVISKDMAQQMMTKHMNDWGLGMYIGGREENIYLVHDGKNEGFTSKLIMLPYHGTALIVMTNGDSGYGLIEEIQQALIEVYEL